jgi:hydroxypyruvate isomerase
LACIDDALGLGASDGVVNVLYGRRRPGRDLGRRTALSNLDHAVAELAPRGITVLLEPLSGFPDYPLQSAEDVISLLEESGPGAAMLVDVYHLAVNGHDVNAVLRRYLNDVGHIQIADVPGRGRPGTGSLDISGTLRTLRELGYRKRVAWEYFSECEEGSASSPSGVIRSRHLS